MMTTATMKLGDHYANLLVVLPGVLLGDPLTPRKTKMNRRVRTKTRRDF